MDDAIFIYRLYLIVYGKILCGITCATILDSPLALPPRAPSQHRSATAAHHLRGGMLPPLPPCASSSSALPRRRPSLPSPRAPKATREGGEPSSLRKQNERRGVGSELGSEYLVLERPLDLSFTIILLLLTSQLNLKGVLEML